MQDSTPVPRLLLGLCGWPRPAWRGGYFPDDLPPDWELTYYSNDADCLCLRAAQRSGPGDAQFGDWLEDIPPHFRFYLDLPSGGLPPGLPDLGIHLGAVLVDKFRELPENVRQLRPDARGYWVDDQGVPRLARWEYAGGQLRALGERLQRLPGTVEALILEGDDLDPRQLGEVRTLAELLGVA
jgi:hypothetical protein